MEEMLGPLYETGTWLTQILDRAVGIATGYGLDSREVVVRIPVGAYFSPLHVVQTGSGAHPASYPMGTGSKAAKA
jgi:hypothetical protein